MRKGLDPADNVATAQHRTNPKQTEALILESRNELQQIYDSLPIMICQLDPRRKVIEANQHFRSFTGWPNDPVALSDKACGVLGCINALEHPRGCGFGPNCKHCALRKALQDTIDTGRPHSNIEYEATLLIQGKRRPIFALASTTLLRKNSEDHVLMSLVDITALKQAEATLRQREAEYRIIVETAQEGVWKTDAEGRTLFVNQSMADMLGYPRWSMQGRPLGDFVAKADRECVEQLLAERKTGGSQQHDFCFRRADATPLWASVSATTVFSEHHEFLYSVALLNDITARQENEQRLSRNAQRLQTLSQRLLSVQEDERRALARDLHDEFGQQMVVLKLNLDRLKRDLQDVTQRRRLEDCIEIAETARESIQTLSRQLRPMILDDLGLSEALHWYAQSQSERLQCRIQVRDPVPALSSTLETAVFRVVQEAINNAVRHGEATHIEIAVAVADGAVSLRIRDDGHGFDPDPRPDPRTPGQGLPGMRERARLLGGRLTITTRPNAGTLVEMQIPITEPPP